MPTRRQTHLHETYLTIEEVEEYIQRLEQKHNVSTADFLRSESVRDGIPEDDLFKWEAYVDHLVELRLVNEETHQEYLSRVVRRTTEGSENHQTSIGQSQASLAALAA